MNNLYIVTKQEFNSLYRFGMIPLILSKVINPLNKTSSELDDLIYNEFLNLPFFVGDEEYIIISFENNLVDNVWLEIENVSEIIPLTKAAKNSIQLKFDTRINFKDARFEHVIHRVEEYIDIQERFRGAKAFCNLCQIDATFQDLVSNEVITKSYYNKISGRKSEEFKEEFLAHLLSYDRYDFFPNSDLGFYYDIGQIFAHSKGKSSLVGSNFHSFLENHKQELLELDFLQIAQIISSSETIEKFTEQLTINEIKIYLASALFLKFKSDLSERETIKGSDTGKLIKKVRDENFLVKELNLAIYLTGAFFGYQKFYDDLYDLVGLRIFKEKVKSNIKEFKTEVPLITQQSEKEILNSTDAEIKLASTYFDKTNTLNDGISENTKDEFTIDPIQLTKIQVEISETIIEKEPDNAVITQSELSDDQEEQKGGIKEIAEASSIEKTNNTSEIDQSEKAILDLLLKFIDEGKGVFELKSDRLNDVKTKISIANPKKNNLKKEEIVQYIRQSFDSFINVDTKGNKSFISKKISNGLFNDY
jgi:hypothetical protein